MHSSLATRTLELPDELELAEFLLVLKIESKEEARLLATELFAKVSSEFAKRHKGASFFYDLEFTVTRSRENSWAFYGKLKGRLKKEWKKYKKKNKKAVAIITTTVAILAGYHEVHDAIGDIKEDATAAYNHVMKFEAKFKGSKIDHYNIEPIGKEKKPTDGRNQPGTKYHE